MIYCDKCKMYYMQGIDNPNCPHCAVHAVETIDFSGHPDGYPGTDDESHYMSQSTIEYAQGEGIIRRGAGDAAHLPKCSEDAQSMREQILDLRERLDALERMLEQKESYQREQDELKD